jgi:hypothetical protein
MQAIVKDTAGIGILLWLIGYLAALLLFVSSLAAVMGWILIAVFTPVSIVIVWRWFAGRDLPLAYYAGAGIVWTAIAIVCDYLFIVVLFSATYYGPDVFVYYAITFLVPVCVGLSKQRVTGKKASS